jgi:hypothetical protein
LASVKEDLIFLGRDPAAGDSENEKGEWKTNHKKNSPFFSHYTTLCYYEAGHQGYVHPSFLKKSRAQVAEFMKDAGPANGALKK